MRRPIIPAIVAEFDDALTKVREYFGESENQARIRRAVSTGIDVAENAILTDSRWRFPRHPDLRRNAFENYLAPYRKQLVASMAQEMAREFPNVLSQENAQITAQIAMTQAEPELQERYWRVLRQQVRFAIRSIALDFLSRNVGDCLLVDVPEQASAMDWSVGVYYRDVTRRIADIRLDQDGNRISDAAELRRLVDAALA